MSSYDSPNGLVYLATKYPLLSETFIYEEIIALKKLGYHVRFFVLYPTGKSSHKFAAELEKTIAYLPRNFSRSSFAGHFHFLFSKPRQYFTTLWAVVKDTYRNPLILFKSIYAFGKGVSLANALKNDPPAHIHSHWATMPTTVAFVASKLTGVTFSFTSHAWDIYREPAMLAKKLESAAFHTTISQYNKNYIETLYPLASNRIYVNRCGVDVEHFSFREKYLTKEPVEILFVGRLVEKKGTIQLVEACAQLYQNGHEFICNIVGDGPQRKALEDAIEKYNLQGFVNLTGELPREQLHAYWEKASMFVLPCTIEKDGNRDGIPVVLMEAMASGIPVISTNISGIPELIEDGVSGLLLPPDDAAQLSDAMTRLITDPELAQRLIVNARKKVEQEYNINLNAQKKADLFKAYLTQEAAIDV